MHELNNFSRLVTLLDELLVAVVLLSQGTLARLGPGLVDDVARVDGILVIALY